MIFTNFGYFKNRKHIVGKLRESYFCSRNESDNRIIKYIKCHEKTSKRLEVESGWDMKK